MGGGRPQIQLVFVVSEERTGWRGGRPRWERSVWVGTRVTGGDERGPAGAELDEAPMSRAAPAELVTAHTHALRDGTAYVALQVEEADVPRRRSGTAHLAPVPESYPTRPAPSHPTAAAASHLSPKTAPRSGRRDPRLDRR